jgi:hypothetical protein
MPKGDKTGPEGQGPMTGRGLGYCAGYHAPGYVSNMYGRGAGRGLGMGRGMGLGFRGGRRHGYYPFAFRQPAYTAPVKEEELYLLKAQAEALKKELEEIQNRISELDTKKSD